ncbi:dUTP diphosphatase [Planctomycetaceae bacterium AH-315-I19]|nr:dUTP diphosphatase [Planctomycetaceae bacterium AH-315-I19]
MSEHTAIETTVATLRVQTLRAGAVVPEYKTDGAAGMDLSALLDAPMTIAPGAIAKVPTGIAMAIPHGYEGQVRPRSGLAFKHGITVINSPGTIDSDYRGELIVGLINLGSEPFTIESGMRIAQLVIAPVTRMAIERSEELDGTNRGTGGFGSTGV